MAEEPSIRIDRAGRVAQIELNRPKSINALDHEMGLAIERALREWASDDTVGAVVITGAGERGLCAGGDIVAIHRDAVALSGSGAGDREAAQSPSAQFWHDEYRLNAYIADYPKPYVPIMDGFVMGGGVGISAHGNTRIVTDRTRLAMPEVGIGFVPDVGGTHLLSRIPDQLGTYAALTASQLNGADVIALGLADHYIPAEKIAEFVASLSDTDIDAALAAFAVEPPASVFAAQREWIAEVFSADDVVEIVDRARALGTPEATKAADTIASKSPAALQVTLRSLRAAGQMSSLPEVLCQEYRVSLRSLLHPDLAEGIRAQVIDKDRTPAWTPAALADVSSGMVDAFFAPLPAEFELTFAAPTEPKETPYV